MTATGTCHALYAYNVGSSIDLNECERCIQHGRRRQRIRGERRAPRYLDYDPPPLRVTCDRTPFQVAGNPTAIEVDVLMFDFGAVSVVYHIPIEGPLEELRRVSEELYDNEALCADARVAVETLLAVIDPAVSRPGLSDTFEDYVIFELQSIEPPRSNAKLLEQHSLGLAQILRADSGGLSDQEVEDALQCRLSFGQDDLAVIDWHAAILVDRAAQDVLSVLEFANVELLELRRLDEQLDAALEEAYETLVRPKWHRRLLGRASPELNRIAMLQVDSAMHFEGVNNALKLLGDHYLARIYQLAAKRFHHKEWDATILRKLSTMESIYDKMSNQAANLRLEVMELIIIILIAVSLVM